MVISVDATRQYTVPRTGRSGPAMLLALLMHVLLGLFLFFGLNWQSHAPEVIQAEVWSALPQISAPVQSVPPPPPPVEVERPKPVEVVPPPPPPVQPDIAIKEPVKKPPEKVAPPPPPPPPPPVQQKIEPKVVKVPPPPPAKVAAPSDLALLQEQAQTGAPSTGKAAQTSGPKGSPGYGQKIAALIRQNIHFNPVGNPTVDLTIQILPGGVVGEVRVTQSSGNASYDDAVMRGVHDASPLPKDTDGTVPNPLYLHYQYSPT